MGLKPEPYGSPPQLTSQFFVHFNTAEGLTSYTLTGVVLLTFQGEATGTDFLRVPFPFTVPIPDLPDEMGLQLVHWAPFVTLNSISNDGTAVNAGWGVDDFTILDTDRIADDVHMMANIAVRDIDGYILRLGYQIHLLGSIKNKPRMRP
jgi:hypothetical protein